ncbi:hypothetical protein [Ramlibacter alkalitolerans]|uniref:Sel1 repeat family protein n=1 Tax=Ramlibacter alkalitolerans TaxID=2039631 RepID=A0ABS1JSQ6_9BURK|nr:hypothetical protein [Ramlibacter alkalitolerans]MBL0427283.1 hypothetical protein [Ramlibacter alkalitolerans]
MQRAVRSLLFAAACLAAGAQAQTAAAPRAPNEELKRLCATIAMAPADPREAARRAECVLAGAIPSTNRFEEARVFARWALSKGEPAGGLMLYLAFQNDPANQFLREGRIDPERYRQLATRTLEQRREQVDAIEGLGFAAGRNYPGAGPLLAAYFHDTLAPRNVSRLGALTALLIRNGEHGSVIERFAREADAIARDGAGTKASARVFLESYREAAAAAQQGYREQAGGKTCEDVQLRSVSAGEIQGAEFLPLTGTLVAESYLVRGHWSEFWTFRACGQEVPVKLTFQADGWGGSSTAASYNKGT